MLSPKINNTERQKNCVWSGIRFVTIIKRKNLKDEGRRAVSVKAIQKGLCQRKQNLTICRL